MNLFNHKFIKRFRFKQFVVLGAFFSLFIGFITCLPDPLFNTPYSTVLLDKNEEVLSAKIALDKQWRFPEGKDVPEKFSKCLIAFEDKYFYYHFGADPLAIARAIIQNIKSGAIKSGGSTITMQVIRLSRHNKKRTIIEKFLEIVLASRLELSYSKKEILSLYAAHAPFGGNIVGLEAASWRYFGRSPSKLSWAETATLAVLPNAPSLIYPGKNQLRLKEKRNRLLDKLMRLDVIDAETAALSKKEIIPEKLYPIPQIAVHLMNSHIAKKGEGNRVISTLNLELQKQLNALSERQQKLLEANEIHNMAVLVAEVSSGNVLAYLGNSNGFGSEEHGNQVDIITSHRSTGSLLKPFLYAAMLDEGELLPGMLVADIPTQIGGFAPKNFNLTYDGAVPAWKALARSLNIPAVKMLQQHGVEKFHYRLQKIGMSTLNKPSTHYGLSLILGGAEGTLWELSAMYASLGRTLKNFNLYNGAYFENDFHSLNYELNKQKSKKQKSTSKVLSAAAIWLTFEAMSEVARPDLEASWKRLSGGRKVAWKTGTSFGFRDGWAVGLTTDYVIGVWVGNADNEGRPGLTGINVAAPILFEVLGLLPKKSSWYDAPYREMRRVKVCKLSGHRAGENCNETGLIWSPINNDKTNACPYHKLIHLDKSLNYRVNDACEKPENMVHYPWFILPPAIEYFYKNKNPSYKTLPPLRKDCSIESAKSMEMIYPKNNTSIYIPVNLNGQQGKAIFEMAHRNPSTIVYWHIDQTYLGATSGIHQMGINAEKGWHKLSLVDENGEQISIDFEVVSDKKN